MSGFAGTLDRRVRILRHDDARDAIGAAAGEWTAIGEGWAALTPAGVGAGEEGGAAASRPRWRIAMRDRDLAPGDRIDWARGRIAVRWVTRDPATPDRLTAMGEEWR